MKRPSILLWMLLLLGAVQPAMAQRYGDMALSIVSPTNGTVIENDESRTFQLQLSNNGPDTLLTSDTIYISGSLLGLPAGAMMRGSFGQPMPPGVSAMIQFSGAAGSIENNRTEPTDTVVELCLSIVTGNLLDTPIASDLLDTLPDNNEACVSVTLKGRPTSITGSSGTAKSALKLYPNPATGAASMDIALPADQVVRVRVKDLSGRAVLYRDYGNKKAGNHILNLDVAALQAGIYVVELCAGEQVQTNKLVIRQE